MAKKLEPPTQSFEESMHRLDEIVAKLEEDKLPLDDMIALYEEGTLLARACGEKLEAVEQRVRLIAQQAGGDVTLENFDEPNED